MFKCIQFDLQKSLGQDCIFFKKKILISLWERQALHLGRRKNKGNFFFSQLDMLEEDCLSNSLF